MLEEQEAEYVEVRPEEDSGIEFYYDHKKNEVLLSISPDSEELFDVSEDIAHMLIASVVGNAITQAELRELPKYEDIVFHGFEVRKSVLEALGFDVDRGVKITISVNWDAPAE